MRVFIDTNLWAYRLDRREPSKAEQISEWLAEVSANHEVVISTQVLIELRSVVTRKLKPALNAEQVGSLLEALSGFEVVGTNANLVLAVHQLAVAEQLSWFDALIVEAALCSRCKVLFSEDFNPGSQIGPLQLINPLLAS